MSPFLDPNDPHYSDTPDVSLHPLEGEKNVRKSIHDGWTPQPQEQEQPGDPYGQDDWANYAGMPPADKPRPYIDMLDPADPPSPLTAYTPGQVEKLRAEWTEHPDWFSYNVGRWIATLDAALASSPAPTKGCSQHPGLDAPGCDACWRVNHHVHDARYVGCAGCAALASSPAPAGLDDALEDIYLNAGDESHVRDVVDRLRAAPAGHQHDPFMADRCEGCAALASPAPAGLNDLLDAIATWEEGGDNRPLGDIVRSWYAALASSPAPSGLDVLNMPFRIGTKDDGSALEFGPLAEALDRTDDVMLSRGHRLSSYSNEEYAAELRKQIRAATRPTEVPVDLGEGRVLQKLSDALRPAEDAQ